VIQKTLQSPGDVSPPLDDFKIYFFYLNDVFGCQKKVKGKKVRRNIVKGMKVHRR